MPVCVMHMYVLCVSCVLSVLSVVRVWLAYFIHVSMRSFACVHISIYVCMCMCVCVCVLYGLHGFNILTLLMTAN